MSLAHASDAVSSVMGSSGSSLMSLLPMILIFVIFYFFLIRPQMKKQRALENMISELKKGDKVIAAGGIHGVIHKLDDNIIHLEVADELRIRVTKSSVTIVLDKDGKPKVENVEKLEKLELEAKTKTKKTKKS